MKTNKILELSLHDFVVDNPTPRIPVVICLDASESMAGQPILDLNVALKKFYEAIYKNDDSRYSAEICVVSFGGEVKVESGFKLVDERYKVNLEANGKTSMGPAILKALNLIEERKTIFKKCGTPFYQPWLVVMTDGKTYDENQDIISEAIKKCNQLESIGKLIVFPIGIGVDANYKLLNKFSTRQRAYKINHSKFNLFFEWLSNSISVVSSSHTGDTINIPTATKTTWGEL